MSQLLYLISEYPHVPHLLPGAVSQLLTFYPVLCLSSCIWFPDLLSYLTFCLVLSQLLYLISQSPLVPHYLPGAVSQLLYLLSQIPPTPHLCQVLCLSYHFLFRNLLTYTSHSAWFYVSSPVSDFTNLLTHLTFCPVLCLRSCILFPNLLSYLTLCLVLCLSSDIWFPNLLIYLTFYPAICLTSCILIPNLQKYLTFCPVLCLRSCILFPNLLSYLTLCLVLCLSSDIWFTNLLIYLTFYPAICLISCILIPNLHTYLTFCPVLCLSSCILFPNLLTYLTSARCCVSAHVFYFPIPLCTSHLPGAVSQLMYFISQSPHVPHICPVLCLSSCILFPNLLTYLRFCQVLCHGSCVLFPNLITYLTFCLVLCLSSKLLSYLTFCPVLCLSSCIQFLNLLTYLRFCQVLCHSACLSFPNLLMYHTKSYFLCLGRPPGCVRILPPWYFIASLTDSSMCESLLLYVWLICLHKFLPCSPPFTLIASYIQAHHFLLASYSPTPQ